MVNTAAFVKAAPLDDGPLEEWDQSFRVNVEAALHLAQACLPHLKRSNRASIVLVASLAGVHGFPRGGGYGPSKAALITLTRQMGLELANYGIRANVVIPGSIETPMSAGHHSAQVRALREANDSMRRLRRPEEVASLIQFLASPAASYLTADAYTCDGGFSQAMFMSTFRYHDGREEPSTPVYRPVPINWMTDSPVRGLAALIVGGASGIGEATAKTFAVNGGLATVADGDMLGAERFAAEIEAAGGRPLRLEWMSPRPARLSAPDRRDRGLWAAGCLMQSGGHGEAAAAGRMFADRLGSLLQRQRARRARAGPRLPAAPAQEPGGLNRECRLTGRNLWAAQWRWAYGPSKSALMTLSKQMALEWSRDGIRVNAVTPGTIDTPLARATVPAEMPRDRAAEISMGRLGTSEVMANLITYLLSPAASYITAQVFNCDGGYAQSMFFVPMGN